MFFMFVFWKLVGKCVDYLCLLAIILFVISDICVLCQVRRDEFVFDVVGEQLVF